MELGLESVKQLERDAAIGEQVDRFANSPDYQLFEEHILKPIEEGAFAAFKKINPAAMEEVVQTQMMGKVVDEIRKRIFGLIQAGKVAREQLLTSTPSEDEDGIG